VTGHGERGVAVTDKGSNGRGIRANRVLVVGGGIAGMATAIALDQAGFEPLVLEQAAEISEIGSGISLQPNGMLVMKKLGAADYVLGTGVRVDRNEWRRLDRSERILSESYKERAVRYDGTYILSMHRADLLESLARRVPRDRIRLESRLVAIEEDPDGVVATLENGEQLAADVLIGADGLRSTVRTILFGEQEARFTGFAAWRGTIPASDMPAGFENSFVMWLGPGRHAMTFPIRPDLQTFNAFVPATEILREEWGPSGDLEDLRRSFHGAASEVMELIDGMTSALITPINFRDPLPVWGTDRVVLVGDAAHPAPPSASQGAGQALEDSVTLAACLRRAGDTNGIPAALAEFAARRQARTAGMLMAARINFGMFNEPNPAQMRARDGRLQGMIRMDPTGETTLGWLFDHDAVAAADLPVQTTPSTSTTMSRPESQRAFEAWQDALSREDRSRMWVGEREGYARFLGRTCPPPDDVTTEELTCGGVRALRVLPAGCSLDGPAVMHLHGGAYTMGSAEGAIDLASRLAKAVGGWAIVPDYRLAPENAFPAALDDVTAVFGWLTREHGAERTIVSGECAGGGLTIAMAIRLRDDGAALPAALHVVSPFCDLTITSPAATDVSGRDPWLGRDKLRLYVASYIHTADPAEALISPVNAHLRGLPPLLIQAAEDEALRDDAVRLAEAADAAGVQVTSELVQDSVHSFVLFDFLPETHAALDQFAVHAASALHDRVSHS
jgi:salicylate hydroxylase